MTGPDAASYHHGDLRAALLSAARAAVEDGGPAALSLRGLARRVGVSAPAAYHHFAGLDAIALAIAGQGFDELGAAMEAAAAARPGAPLTAMGETYVGFARANPGLYRLMYGEALTANPVATAALRDQRERAYGALKAGLAARMADDEVAERALFLWSLVHGLALLLIDGQLDPGADADALVRGVLRRAGAALPRPSGG